MWRNGHSGVGALEPMARIDICICTFRRLFLADTLHSVARQATRDHTLRVIIADNDHTPSARELVERLRAHLPFPVAYVHAPAANICVARNACLEQVEADFVAFIDDDEVCSPGWILALVDMAEKTGAAAVL